MRPRPASSTRLFIRWVARLDLEQQILESARSGEGEEEPDREADDGQCRPVTNHHSDEPRARGPESRANGEFVTSADGPEVHDAVQADQRK
jgi:hypothetical protein